MSVTLIGDCPLYGDPDNKPQLPPGFEYVINNKDFLLAVNGSKVFYVRPDKLVLRKIATVIDQDRTGYKLRAGKPYFDDRETIPL